MRAITPIGGGHDMRITIGTPSNAAWADTAGIAQGASICCAGCCLTAVALHPNAFEVEVSAETLSKTALGGWTVGSHLNLERSLRLGDELGGHLVSGHVDGLGRVVSITPENGSTRIEVEVPQDLSRFIAPKGSVAVDGVSLTVNQVAGTRFGVNIIPHTGTATTLGALRPGSAVHIEIDTLARYVARLHDSVAEAQSSTMQTAP